MLQCAGLIHDIGNPPFGHYGEVAIREWFERNLSKIEFHGRPVDQLLNEQMLADLYHFEGNAQALRLVTKLHFLVDEHGMNLTYALLNTIVKYPVPSHQMDPHSEDIKKKKMGYYYADEAIFREIEKETGTNEFRHLVEEIAMLEGFEALNDLPLEEVEIETPIEKCKTPMIAGRKLAIVPILRAGLGMVEGILALVPSAKIGHIGLYRDEETFEPHEYYCKLPSPIEERTIVVCDPMLATGGSAIDAITMIKKHGGRNIKFMCIIAAPEGVKALHEAHPDVQIYIGHLDRCLNEHAYICPGLGDAGDRIFGTK